MFEIVILLLHHFDTLVSTAVSVAGDTDDKPRLSYGLYITSGLYNFFLENSVFLKMFSREPQIQKIFLNT